MIVAIVRTFLLVQQKTSSVVLRSLMRMHCDSCSLLVVHNSVIYQPIEQVTLRPDKLSVVVETMRHLSDKVHVRRLMLRQHNKVVLKHN